MTINLFDDTAWFSLRPLTFTRPVANLRIGILTIAEKWAKHFDTDYGYITTNYLQQKYPLKDASLYINGSICPDENLLSHILGLKDGQVLLDGTIVIAYQSSIAIGYEGAYRKLEPIAYTKPYVRIRYTEDIFTMNDLELRKDFALVTKGRQSARLDSSNTIIGDDIFVEEGANALCSTFNTKWGPIYLGKNSSVWEGSMIRGSFALCENADVKMGARIYSKTTVGPYSRVGGEISNVVFWGHSAKGHDGFLGNSVLGEWCNIGADTNASNLKNNYAEVRLWDYEKSSFRKTGLQFCGLIMADHAKTGINTMLNTGTVVGVGANVFGSGFPRQFVPDFAWGGANGFETYQINKMIETAQKVLARKNLLLDEVEMAILNHIFELTKTYRNF